MRVHLSSRESKVCVTRTARFDERRIVSSVSGGEVFFRAVLSARGGRGCSPRLAWVVWSGGPPQASLCWPWLCVRFCLFCLLAAAHFHVFGSAHFMWAYQQQQKAPLSGATGGRPALASLLKTKTSCVSSHCVLLSVLSTFEGEWCNVSRACHFYSGVVYVTAHVYMCFLCSIS